MALKQRVKAGYGAADFGLSAGELLLQLYLLEFYISGVGLSAKLAGLALALAVLWDAVSDPIMGSITDRTRTRWGRFAPYLLSGGLVFGASLVALFNPPELTSQWALFAYLLFTYLMVNTGMTIIGVPHIAMGGALCNDTHERTQLYGWRLVFGTIGLFFGILAPLFAVGVFQFDVTTAEGLAGSRGVGAWGVAFVIIIFAWITIFSTRKIKIPEVKSKDLFVFKDFIKSLQSLLDNPYFKPLFFSFLIVAMARTMNSVLALPYYKNSLGLSEAEVQKSVLFVFILFIVLSVPIWVYLGKRFGKKLPGFIGLSSLGILTAVAYMILPKGELLGPVLVAVIGGTAVGAIILFDSMLTDVADWDFVNSGKENEGLYFGMWRMGQKITRSIALAGTGWALEAIGYVENSIQQSAETEQSLRILFGPVVGALFFLSGLLFLFTPLSKKKQEEIQDLKAELLNPESGKRKAESGKRKAESGKRKAESEKRK